MIGTLCMAVAFVARLETRIRHSRNAERKECRLARKGQRRAIPQIDLRCEYAAPVSVRHFPISDFDMPETGSICDGDRFAELRIGCRGTFLAHYPEISLDLSFTDAPDWPIASQTLRRSYSTDWFLASGTIGEALRPGQRLRCSEIQARGQSFRQRGQLV